MDALIQKIVDLIVNPLLEVVFALALVYFIYGVVKYAIASDSPDDRTAAANHILWASLGMTLMFGVYGVINLILRTIGQ